MAKGTRGRRRISSRHCRPTPYGLPSFDHQNAKKISKILEKKDWVDATCSVCMEYPHNAVLLLCSSHDNGCRPYMCGTSVRYSNCLDQYKKAYAKVACPLCRGQVKGWTVVEPAREYLNARNRICTQDNCSFAGTYQELRKHVRTDHPCARPREVDPVLDEKWRRLEREREREDVVSTIRSSMPGAVVFGDYVLEGSRYGFDTGGGGGDVDGFDAGGGGADTGGGLELGINRNLVNALLLLHALGPDRNVGTRRHEGGSGEDSDGGGGAGSGGGNGGELSLVHRLRRQGRFLLGRSGRRRRRRESGGGQRDI